MKNNVPRELSFYAMYLRNYLQEIDSSKKNDETFIDERTDDAEKEWEDRRRDGLTIDQADECAIDVLVRGISEDEEIDSVSSEKNDINSEETIDNDYFS